MIVVADLSGFIVSGYMDSDALLVLASALSTTSERKGSKKVTITVVIEEKSDE